MKEEVTNILKSAKPRKAAGPDEEPSELLKLLDDDGIDMLVDLFNTIYASGNIPEEWLTSTIDYRTIALMSHTLKLFLKILHRRIYAKLENDIRRNLDLNKEWGPERHYSV